MSIGIGHGRNVTFYTTVGSVTRLLTYCTSQLKTAAVHSVTHSADIGCVIGLTLISLKYHYWTTTIQQPTCGLYGMFLKVDLSKAPLSTHVCRESVKECLLNTDRVL